MQHAFNDSDIKHINEAVLRFKPQTQIAVAKIKNDEVSFYGSLMKEDGKPHFAPNSAAVFEIGSISKVFTSTLLAQMAIEGLVSLNDNLEQLLGYALHKNAEITLQELSNHTSGLPRLPPSMFWKAVFGSADNPYKEYGPADIEQEIRNRIKLKKKGKSRYSNFGAGLLAYTLGEIEGKPYEQLLQDRIFTPLDMKTSSINANKFGDQLVSGRNKKGQDAANWEFQSLAGAGAILSSVKDLTKFLQANFNTEDPAIKLQQTPTAKLNFMDQVALGWMVQKHKITNDRTWHWHNGGTGGYSSAMVMDTDAKTGVVVLSNISGLFLLKSQLVTNLAFNIHKDMQVSPS